MIRALKKLILIITFCFVSPFTFSQSKEIKIEFLGNCGFHMTDGITDFYVDFPINLELTDIWNSTKKN